MVHTEILRTPSYAAGKGVWTFYGSATINAPASEVWKTIIDFQNYSKWNLYTPTVDTPSGADSISPGDKITLHYRPERTGSLLDVPCTILYVDVASMEVSWRGEPSGIPTWIFLPEKIQKVTPKADGECFYEVWETQGGPMAWIVKWTMGMKLSAMSDGMAKGLKEWIEDGTIAKA